VLLYVDDRLIASHDMNDIQSLKIDLSKSLAMKDLIPTKQIFSMIIVCDKKNGKLWFSQ